MDRLIVDRAYLAPGSPARAQAMRLAVVRVGTRIHASPERVFAAWLDPAVAGAWLFATASRPLTRVAIDGRVQGRFCLVEDGDGEYVEYSGAYVEIVPPRRLAFSLASDKYLPATQVLAEFAPAKVAGVPADYPSPRVKQARTVPASTRLTVTHRDIPREYAHRMEARWTGMLYGLGAMLDQQSAGGSSRARQDRR